MRRRSRAGGKSPNAQTPKAAARKSGIAPKAERPRISSVAREETKEARLTRERDEALEQQKATSELLGLISRSNVDLQMILQRVLETAARLCRAEKSVLFRRDDKGVYRFAAAYGALPAYVEIERATQIWPGPGTVIGRAAMSRRVVRIDDVLIDPLYEKKVDAKVGDFRSALGIPLMRENEPIGVIGLGRSAVDPFSEREIELTKTFASQAVIAIENARLLNELRQSTDDLSQRTADLTESLQQQTATSDVLKLISRSTFDLQSVLDTLVESAARLCGAPHGLIFRFDGTSARAVAAYNNVPGFKELWADNPVLPNRATATGRAIVERRAIHIPDVLSDPEYNPPKGALKRAQKLGQYRTTLVVPMLREGVPLGTITLWKTKVEPYTDKQIELVTTFADQAVIAIENVRLFEAEQQRKRELTESLEQQTATAKVLQVISRSTFDLQTVLSTLVESAARLCLTDQAALFLRDGDVYRMATTYGYAGDAAKYADMPPLRPDRTSMTGRVALEGKAVHVHDVLADPEYRANEYQQAFGYRTNLSVPLLRDGTTIGVLALVRTEVNPFSEKQIELVTTFADQAVIAIENARLFNETKEALERQTATAEVLNVIASSPTSAQPVFDAIAHSAAELCEGTNSGVFRLQDGLVHLVGHHNLSSRQLELTTRAFPAPVGRGFMAGRAILDRAVAHVPDIAADPEYTADAVVKAGFRSAVSVPMLRNGEPIGAINVTREEARAFSDAQVELLKSFADQAVIAIENARLFEAEQERARELTESLEQQSATANVLEVISRSAFDLHAVFETVAESSVRLCDADRAFIMRFDGELLRMAVAYNVSQEFRDFVERNPVPPGRHSAAGRVALERQTIHIPDVLADPEYTYGARAFEQFRTVLGVPILKGEELLGVMIIYHVKDVRPFTEKQIALIETFADQAAIAIENVRLFEAEQQRTKELTESLEQQTATSEVLQAISSSQGDLGPVFAVMLEKAARICDASYGNIYLWDGDALHYMASHNTPEALVRVRKEEPLSPEPASPLGIAIATKSTWHTADARKDPGYVSRTSPSLVAGVDLGGIRALLFVPMLKEGELVGMFSLFRHEARAFTDKQIELVQNFAAQAVIAIENARLLTELRTRTDELGRSVGELRALGEISQAVNSTLDLQTVLETIVTKAAQLSNADAGAIYVFDDADREFHLRATYGMDEELIEAIRHARISGDERNIGNLLANRQPAQTADLEQEASSAVDKIVLRAGYRSRLVAPLFRGDDIVGLLVVRRRTPGAFPPGTVDLMKTFAAQSAVAIQNARLYENVGTRTRELAASLQDLRTAQDRLVQTEKLASLGQLTAGIAHEIKNPLNFVNNFSSLSAELIDELTQTLATVSVDDKTRAEITELSGILRGNLEKVVQHGKRADSIVKNMLLHSRQGSGERRLVDLNALVEESLNLAYHGARAENESFNITLERSFDPTAGEIDLFPQEITRVLLNLISNGFYAATKRKAEFASNGFEPTLVAGTKSLGDRVEISIRDNGAGISPDAKDKIFNPFFTTKPAGEGTGLGLSISHDIIVKQHSGSIEVDTELGQFTEFRIILPRTAV